MFKTLGAVFRLVFSLLVVAALVGNTWQIARLQDEIRTLKQPHPPIVQQGAATSRSGPDRGALFGRAREHAERAQALLRNKEYVLAQRELHQALETFEKASRRTSSHTREALTEFRGAVRSLSHQADALWQQAKESEKK